MGGTIEQWMSDLGDAECVSITLEQGLDKLANEMIDAIPEWLRQFHESLADE